MNNLKTAGIVCEFNPFHYGHKYIIEYAKNNLNADAVICIMSGSFVQRGDTAVFDKWSRAKTAVQNGADLVIELPVYYVLQSAQKFAYGAIKILNDLNCVDMLAFGSENSNMDLLNKISDLLYAEPEQFKSVIKDELKKGGGYPYAIDTAIKKSIDGNITLMPNDRLAINYLTALKKLNSNIQPAAIKRNNLYHSDIADNLFASATAVRKMIANKEDFSKFAPNYNNVCIYDIKNIESLILGFFRTVKADAIKNTVGFEDGFENLVIRAARKSRTLNEFYDMLTSKRYTNHRVRRAVLCALLGISGEFTADYVRPLAFNKTGAKILSAVKANSHLPVIAKTADFNINKHSMLNIDIRATDIASLCAQDINYRIAGKDYITSPALVTSEL